jgi:CxxC motif-containing protein (DUF1111 family)
VLTAGVVRAHEARAGAGDPLPGLSPAHLTWFTNGLAAFNKVYTPETGLGPMFNAESCVACHSVPAPGGGSEITVTRFAKDLGNRTDPLRSSGGPLLQTEAIDPACVETVPAEADVVVHRLTTPMFGAGLIEAVLDEDIFALADPDDRDGNGISGRVHLVQYPGRLRVGRFGWKSQEATLISFTGDALATEMGITNALVPGELAPNGDTALLATCEALEGQADPEDGGEEDEFSDIVNDTNYTRLLAPPVPQVRPRGRGWHGFRRARCTACHVARMTTGPHTIPALSEQRFYPYSDFLLHDMGALGDGITQDAAEPTEMRTSPLWGISLRTRYLHDGRATTLFDAVAAHDGEAAEARERFLAMAPLRQAALIAFLSGL